MVNSGFIFGLASLLAVAALCLLFLYIFVTTQRNVILRAQPEESPVCSMDDDLGRQRWPLWPADSCERVKHK